jgi:predicted  nucleic acid-binding Zn-ribbon protein
VSLIGFQPLFDSTVELKLPKGPFLIMGGNAMGKTTTLQAVVFALAGEADEEVEPDKRARVTARYFSRRLNKGQSTEIRVEFELGEMDLAVRRGIGSDAVLGVKIGDDEWIHDSVEATEKYEEAVVRAGGYASFEDFRFLLHRLAYLPETRQSLVWDERAQTRVVMLVCSDAAQEGQFRDLSKRLRDIDTEKRHMHVDIGHLHLRINRLEAAEKSVARKQAEPEVDSKALEAVKEMQTLQTELLNISKQRGKVFAQAEAFGNALVTTNERLEKFQEQLTAVEDSFILRTLRNVEANTPAVALQKLLVYHLCPYCSQQSDALAAAAHESLSRGNCPICNQPHEVTVADGDVTKIRKAVSQANRERDKLERENSACHTTLGKLSDEEYKIRSRLEQIRGKLPRIPKEGAFEVDTSSVSALRKTLQFYNTRHAELESEWQTTKRRLDAEFAEFTESCSIRLLRLQKAASDYGRAFLGESSKCEFVPVPARGELGDVTFFVPSFAEKKRPTPETCSESERFFLDIGFRMALLELAGTLSNSTSTFICETPENALDLAYTDNVASMFARFARKGFSILLTANIQAGGVAKPLLNPYPKAERQRRAFNLLHAGHPSDVQQSKLRTFDTEMANIVGGKRG